MGAVVEGAHDVGHSDIGKHCNDTFFKLATSIPLVADTLSYVKEEYNKVKNQNQLLTSLMNGVEKSVIKVTSVAYNISKNVVPYDYVDELAVKGLKRIEEKYPLIKKPTNDVWKECSVYTLATISGVKDKKKMPKNLSEAVNDRIYLMAESTSHSIGDIKFVKAVSSVAHKLLNKLESMLDNNTKAQKKKSKKTELLIERLSDFKSRLNKKLKGMAKEAAEIKKEVRDLEQKLSLKDLWNIVENRLKVLYDNLKIHPSNENIFAQSWRLFKLTAVTIMLSGMVTMDAVMPKIINFIDNIYYSIKKVVMSFINLIKKYFHSIYKLAHHFVRQIAKIMHKFFTTLKHLLEVLWNDLVKIEHCIEEEFEHILPAGSSGSSTPTSETDDEEKMVRSPSKIE